MKKIFYLLVAFLSGTAVLKAQYVAPADYETMSGQHTATGSNIRILTLPGAIGTLRVIGRSPDGSNYTTGEYRLINGGWNYPLQQSITTLASVTRGAGVSLSVNSADGGHGTMNIVISATGSSLIYWSFDGLLEPGYPKVGDIYKGGIVFYILKPGDPGYDDKIQHGLIAAPTDLSTVALWDCGTEITGADGTAIGTGNQNTLDITFSCSLAGTAARMCSSLTLNGYSDWYLPSKDELSRLYLNRNVVGGFSSGNYYWSSSESSAGTAWCQNFNRGEITEGNKRSRYLVRAVRAF